MWTLPSRRINAEAGLPHSRQRHTCLSVTFFYTTEPRVTVQLALCNSRLTLCPLAAYSYTSVLEGWGGGGALVRKSYRRYSRFRWDIPAGCVV